MLNRRIIIMICLSFFLLMKGSTFLPLPSPLPSPLSLLRLSIGICHLCCYTVVQVWWSAALRAVRCVACRALRRVRSPAQYLQHKRARAYTSIYIYMCSILFIVSFFWDGVQGVWMHCGGHRDEVYQICSHSSMWALLCISILLWYSFILVCYLSKLYYHSSLYWTEYVSLHYLSIPLSTLYLFTLNLSFQKENNTPVSFICSCCWGCKWETTQFLFSYLPFSASYFFLLNTNKQTGDTRLGARPCEKSSVQRAPHPPYRHCRRVLGPWSCPPLCSLYSPSSRSCWGIPLALYSPLPFLSNLPSLSSLISPPFPL